MKQICLKEKNSFVTFENLGALQELSQPTEENIEEGEKHWFLYEGEEEYERTERKKNNMQLNCCTALSSLHYTFSDVDNVIRKQNRISRKGDKKWENCLIGEGMNEGIHRITFVVKGACLFGLIDSSQALPSNGKNILQDHIGLYYV